VVVTMSLHAKSSHVRRGGTGPWTSKYKLTNEAIGLDEVMEEERHEGVPRDGPKEHNEEVDKTDKVPHRLQG
jgi:hypothetical protein